MSTRPVKSPAEGEEEMLALGPLAAWVVEAVDSRPVPQAATTAIVAKRSSHARGLTVRVRSYWGALTPASCPTPGPTAQRTYRGPSVNSPAFQCGDSPGERAPCCRPDRVELQGLADLGIRRRAEPGGLSRGARRLSMRPIPRKRRRRCRARDLRFRGHCCCRKSKRQGCSRPLRCLFVAR